MQRNPAEVPKPTLIRAATAVLIGLFALWAGIAAAASEEACDPSFESPGYCGDEGPATDARLGSPFGVARLRDGQVLIADSGNNRIRSVAEDGTITTVAGTGVGGFSGDDGPAIEAQLSFPTGVAPARHGGFLIADTGNHRVRLVSPRGRITTVAGNGRAGFSGDGGQATSASLFSPTDVARRKGGGFLIADNGNRRVRRVSRDGIIKTVAGDGRTGSSGDGGPAARASLNTPTGITRTSGRAFLIADAASNRVRRVAADGTISTVAGTGTEGSAGDGGPAIQAELAGPSDVGRLEQGFLIADTGNQLVRRVSATGEISTVAGTGLAGFAGDGEHASEAELTAPTGIVGSGDGSFLIADNGNLRVRKVSPGGEIETLAGSGATSDDASALAKSIRYPARKVTCYFSHGGTKTAVGHRIAVGFTLSSASKVKVTVVKSSHVVRKKAKRSQSGFHALRMAGVHRPGRYSMNLSAGRPRPSHCDRQPLKVHE